MHAGFINKDTKVQRIKYIFPITRLGKGKRKNKKMKNEKRKKKTSGCNVTNPKTLVLSFAPDFASEGKKKKRYELLCDWLYLITVYF